MCFTFLITVIYHSITISRYLPCPILKMSLAYPAYPRIFFKMLGFIGRNRFYHPHLEREPTAADLWGLLPAPFRARLKDHHFFTVVLTLKLIGNTSNLCTYHCLWMPENMTSNLKKMMENTNNLTFWMVPPMTGWDLEHQVLTSNCAPHTEDPEQREERSLAFDTEALRRHFVYAVILIVFFVWCLSRQNHQTQWSCQLVWAAVSLGSRMSVTHVRKTCKHEITSRANVIDHLRLVAEHLVFNTNLHVQQSKIISKDGPQVWAVVCFHFSPISTHTHLCHAAEYLQHSACPQGSNHDNDWSIDITLAHVQDMSSQ